MPLLNKKQLNLKTDDVFEDDEEVFYYPLTNEIFRDYEEYCERIIICNSLIWSCAITGKSNLTYHEALASEENALKSIKDFPAELRTPILYLASLTQRTSFTELTEDVFLFVKDRYFAGESLEASFEDEEWLFAHVLKVIAPTEEEIEEYYKDNSSSKRPKDNMYPGVLYKYKIERLDEDEAEPEVRVVNSSVLKRRKGIYSREKNRIYLKQFAEQKKDLKWGIQDNILAKYSIGNLKFNQIFVGDPPKFEPSKKVFNSNKVIQQSLKKYLVPTTEPNSTSQGNTSVKEYFEKMYNKKVDEKVRKTNEIAGKVLKRYQNSINKTAMLAKKEALKQEALEAKMKKLEEMRQRKEKEKADKERLANFVKEWQRKREDLECEDLKELPSPTPVECRIPNEYFGDFLLILEFFYHFREVLRLKDFFPFGLNFDLVERALVDVELAGPFSDILQLLMVSLFSLQEQEDDEIQNTRSDRSTDLCISETGDVSMTEAVKLATSAANWSRLHHGTALKELALDVYTVSEILRLHLLSSGGRAGDTSAKWRYQERGGYVNTDDPGLQLRINDPHILRFLAVKSVGELPIEDKIKLLTCLMNQILTYAELRDVIEERSEKVRTGKNELKNNQIAESKKERELLAQKLKERKEAKEKGETYPEETEEQKQKTKKENEKKKMDFHKRLMELQDAAMGFQLLPLGCDRGHRRFWIFSSLPGLFVEDDERWPGGCLPHPTPVNKILIQQEEDTMSYVRKLFEEERNGGSDKENEGDPTQPLGVSRKKLLGEANSANELSNLSSHSLKSPTKEDEVKVAQNLFCTANPETCQVHSLTVNRTKWKFYYIENDINNLINRLNKRGYREHGLRKTLLESRDRFVPLLSKCPIHKLNRFIPVVSDLQLNLRGTKGTAKGYENANFKFPPGTPLDEILELQIRDVILDVEEKIFAGGLGSLKVKDRDLWRSAIENRSYDKQCDGLVWGRPNSKSDSNKNLEKVKAEEGGSRPETPCSIDSNSVELGYKQDQNPVVKSLASAVLQIAQSIEPRYLQKPLPYEEKKKESENRAPTAMERWESSLMSSTSFSQIYLHVATIENSIQWKKSALNARCKVCRRGGDPENMLLCDGCDKGYHLYCLKPKLNSIPTGDWFCLGCRPKEKKDRPRKSRKLFSEESDDEDVVVSRSGRRCKKIIDYEEDKKRNKKNESVYEPYTYKKKKKKIKKGRVEDVKKNSHRQSDESNKRSSKRRSSDDEPLSTLTLNKVMVEDDADESSGKRQKVQEEADDSV